MQKKNNRNGIMSLYLPMASVVLWDIVLTIRGNWGFITGKTKIIGEENPLGLALFKIHPAAFIAGVVVYLIVLYLALRYLSPLLKLVLYFAVVLPHTIAAQGWLGSILAVAFGAKHPNLAYLLGIAVPVVIGICAAFGVWRYVRFRKLNGSGKNNGQPRP